MAGRTDQGEGTPRLAAREAQGQVRAASRGQLGNLQRALREERVRVDASLPARRASQLSEELAAVDAKDLLVARPPRLDLGQPFGQAGERPVDRGEALRSLGMTRGREVLLKACIPDQKELFGSHAKDIAGD